MRTRIVVIEISNGDNGDDNGNASNNYDNNK